MVSWSHFETFLSAGRKWLPGPIIFIVLVVILFALRHVLLRWIARAVEHRGQWIDPFLRALSPSLTVAIVVAALAVGMGFEPIPVHWRRVADAILTGGIILALIVLVDGLLMFWMRRAAARFPVLGESYAIVVGFVRGIVFGIGALTFLESIGISVGPILATSRNRLAGNCARLAGNAEEHALRSVPDSRLARAGRRLRKIVERTGRMAYPARMAQQQVSYDEREYRDRSQFAVGGRDFHESPCA
jgi:hypothetical protein